MTPFHLTDFELNSNLWFHFCKCQFPVSLFKTSIFFNQLISFLPGGGGGTPVKTPVKTELKRSIGPQGTCYPKRHCKCILRRQS